MPIAPPMQATLLSLLPRLKEQPDAQAWEQFVRLSTPLLLNWSRRLGLREHDAADLVQDVLVVLVRKLPGFRYEPGKNFLGWLRAVLRNKCRDRRVAPGTEALDDAAEVPAPADGDGPEEDELRLYVLGRALRLMSSEFAPATWQACWETVVCGRDVRAVAAGLGLTVNAVYVARSRVLARLRQALRGLPD
jgi:RNA polymerase sigma-70 factor, ECF subfamily